LQSGDSNIYIGDSGGGNESGTIRIGKCLGGIFGCTHTRFFAAGVATTGVSGVQVLVGADGQLGVASSSRRFKEDVRDMGQATEGLMRLRPVTFYYKQAEPGAHRQLQYGLIAEEVAEVYPELVEYSATGEPFTVRYQLLGAMLLNEVQRQQSTIDAQAAEIATLKRQSARIAEMLERLTRIEDGR
jgi:hypothetical protein